MKAPKLDCVVVRYGEIALKGGNRRMFEEKLKSNIIKRLDADGIPCARAYRVSGRIIANTGKPQAAAESLSRVFGVTSASPAVKIKPNIEAIKETALAVFLNLKPKPKSFRVSVRRLEKKIIQTSQEINERAGELIVEETGCAVNLENPELEAGVEVGGKEAYVFTKTRAGVGGLPVGVAGKVVVLFSGGIDSPAAAYLCMKRGCETILLHLAHADSISKPPKKIEKIRNRLKQYHHEIPLICVPAGDIERELVMKVPAEYRIILLRRILLRIGEKLAKKHKAIALASGDNLGQVASQTLTNLDVIDRAVEVLCVRPLISYDKQEIVDLAREIGTYDDSILPYTDCCSFLLPKHPSTAAKLADIMEAESRIDESVVEKALSKAATF